MSKTGITPETTFSVARDKIRELSDPYWKWPGAHKENRELHYAIYLEPTGNNQFRPFLSLKPRFYFVSRLDWGADPTIWTYYHPYKAPNGDVGGDSLFPSCADGDFKIASIVGNTVTETVIPGQLNVAFEAGTSRQEAAFRLQAASPAFQILDVISPAGNLYLVSCRPFGEKEDGKTIGTISGVRYAEPNSQVSLIRPGGYWKITRLL
jgi:hypothetical protein